MHLTGIIYGFRLYLIAVTIHSVKMKRIPQIIGKK